jgi:hypothetical protein
LSRRRRLQDAVLFPQEFDDITLLAFEPAEQSRQDQRQQDHARVHDKLRGQSFRTWAADQEKLRRWRRPTR